MDQRLMVYHAKVNLIYRKLREKKKRVILKIKLNTGRDTLARGFLRNPKIRSKASSLLRSNPVSTIQYLN